MVDAVANSGTVEGLGIKVIRGDRSLNVESDSPIGAVTYTEEGFWELLSTTPRS